MYRIVCIPLLVFLFNSCDEKIINFVPGPEDGLNFENKSFNLSVEQSSFTNTPKYISQDLGPLLYAGSIMESGQTSSALFQINSQILEGYNLCSENEDIENRGDIKFRLAVHTEIWDQEHLTLYYYNNDIDFSEDTINNHDSSNIENITSMIKSGGDLLETEVGEQESGRYILTSTLLNIDECTFENNQEDCVDSEYNECSWNENECSNSNSDISAFITWDNLCNLDNSSNYFYILLEYANPDDFIHIYSSDIVSSEPILSLVSPGMVDVPSLMVSYEKKSEMTILNSRFNINHNIGYTSLNIDDIMYSDNLYNWKFSCNSNTDLESCENYEYCTWNTEDSENPKCLWSDVESDHNIIIANTNSTLDNFGTLYGLQMDNSNQAIYQGSNLDEPATFTIDIELDTNVPSDSLIFIFTKASFNYGNDNINQHECNWNGNA